MAGHLNPAHNHKRDVQLPRPLKVAKLNDGDGPRRVAPHLSRAVDSQRDKVVRLKIARQGSRLGLSQKRGTEEIPSSWIDSNLS